MASSPPSADDVSIGDALSGKLNLEVEKDSITKEIRYSPEIKVGGMQWKMGLGKVKGQDVLEFYLDRNENHGMRSVDVSIECKLINHADDEKSLTVEIDTTLNQNVSHYSLPRFIQWSEAINQDKGFLKDNKFLVVMKFRLSNIVESRKRRRVEFTDPDEPSHDVTLVIGNEKFFVSKSYLSILSPVFHSMFYGQFVEKDLKEIELKDLNRQEFSVLMKVIYPPHEKITEDNFKYLLKLGDRFQMESVLDKCEQFLLKSKLNVAAKLLFSDSYRLLELQEHCLAELKTVKDVTDLKKSKESKNFSDAVKLALFEKINKLS